MEKETRRSAEMRRVLEEFASSGKNRRQFCEERGIVPGTFDYWRRKFEGNTGMVRVEVAGLASPAAAGFTLGLTNGRRIECGWRFADADLARLIRIAENA
jgi:hypothetical protein